MKVKTKKGGSSCSPFDSMSLTPLDTAELEVLTKSILEANLDRYQLFSDVENGTADPRTWKLTKNKDQMSAYVQRQQRYDSFPYQAYTTTDNSLQSLLCVGSTPGMLDDVMSGIADPCAGDGLSRTAVLSIIRKPSSANKSRSVVVKWMELDVRLKSMGLVKNHDYVFVESTGMLRLPSGGRVGYHLLHSIDHPDAHDLPGRVRGKLSVCSFFRQLAGHSVSVYTLGMMDAMTDQTRRVVMPRFINTLLSTLKRCGGAKKQGKKPARRFTEPETSSFHTAAHSCVICMKRVSRLGEMLKRHSTCSACCGCVCSLCKVEMKAKLMTADLKVTQRKVVFCRSCLSIAIAASAPGFSFIENTQRVAGFYTADYQTVWDSRSRHTTPLLRDASFSVAFHHNKRYHSS